MCHRPSSHVADVCNLSKILMTYITARLGRLRLSACLGVGIYSQLGAPDLEEEHSGRSSATPAPQDVVPQWNIILAIQRLHLVSLECGSALSPSSRTLIGPWKVFSRGGLKRRQCNLCGDNIICNTNFSQEFLWAATPASGVFCACLAPSLACGPFISWRHLAQTARTIGCWPPRKDLLLLLLHVLLFPLRLLALALLIPSSYISSSSSPFPFLQWTSWLAGGQVTRKRLPYGARLSRPRGSCSLSNVISKAVKACNISSLYSNRYLATAHSCFSDLSFFYLGLLLLVTLSFGFASCFSINITINMTHFYFSISVDDDLDLHYYCFL